jgi:plasmid stabilization system protein ParE
MELTVYWTRIAENKLTDIYIYYETEAGINIAEKLVQGIIDRTINLEKNPFIGQKEELLAKRPQEFRYLVFTNYKIIYWVNTNKNRIDIVNVFNTSQNPNKITEIR